MKELTYFETQSVLGGRMVLRNDEFESSIDNHPSRISSSSDDKDNDNDTRETYEKWGGRLVGGAFAIAGYETCGSPCGVAGEIIGEEVGSFLGKKMYDDPESFRHPDMDTIWDDR